MFLNIKVISLISQEEKERDFKQTIIHIRNENRSYLKSASALKGIPMYELLDEILTEKRKEFLKKVNK